MTTADEIIDAEIVSRTAVLREAAAAKARLAAGKAKAGAATGGKAAGLGVWALIKRTGRGLAASPRDLLAYWADLAGAIDVAEAAPGDPTTKAKFEHETTKRKHRANVTGFVLASLAWCTAGWTALAWTVRGPGGYGVVAGWWMILVGVTGLASRGVWAGKHKDGWLWPTRLWGAIAVSVVALFVHLALDRPAWQLTVAWLVPVLGWLTWAASDGEVFGDGHPDVAVSRVDEPRKAEVTESRTALAIAKGLKVGIRKDGGVDPEAAAGEVTIIGTPGKDHRGVWTVTHFQLTEKAVSDLQDDKKAIPRIATTLRRDEKWVYLDGVPGDASQGLLYVADANPWPEQATMWPGLETNQHDIFLPVEVGSDLLRGTPLKIPVAQSHELVAGGSGAGKTAFFRLTSCVAVADGQGCEHDIADFKGDGALDMYEPLCSFYVSGQEDEKVAEFAEWLHWARHEEAPRRKAVMRELVKSRRAPDARLTRELARDPEVPIKLRVTTVDEAQIAMGHRKYGKRITEDMIFFAQQGRSFAWRFKAGVQKATSGALNQDFVSILATRVCGRAEDYATSYAALDTNLLRADTLPEIPGVFIIIGTGDGDGAWRGNAKFIAHYIDANHAADFCQRIIDQRRASGTLAAPSEPEVPRVLLEMQRLLSEPSRRGRMLSVELAAALVRYEILTVTQADLDAGKGKSEDQVRQEKLAALVQPHGVYARPDRDAGNRMAYWLTKRHRDYGDVGVAAAIARIEAGKPLPSRSGYGASPDGSAVGSPAGSPHQRRLHVV